ncbi:MAG: adenosylcobinamide-GDP ribazoletransferase [Candidatus Latescibacteria bacterium]|jgi:adenosylcobinamide-GDP ribazoletransferase|nr:adenosylcobinamide-GDP ribazoletransferase [Candidatus Latescibacterota bacterium]
MSRFWASVRFLTAVPVPRRWGEDVEALARSTPFFPVVGLLIGLVGAACCWQLQRVLPNPVAAVLLVVLLMAASRGLHMDGLADTADAFLSSRTRERMLEIMRDSHIGAMGVLAVVSVIVLKVTALATAADADRWRAMLLMPLAGRAALVVSMAVLPYARPDGGLGTVFFRRRPWISALWSVLVLAGVGWAVAGPRGLIAAATATAATLGMAWYSHRKVGGATGDTLGASCEIVECVPAIVLVAGSP